MNNDDNENKENKENSEIMNVSIPKYLIIKVNTRIKKARQFTYQPKMTDRRTRAQYVLFDPLIELKDSAVTPQSFFSRSLFELAKDKSLRSQLFGQKKKDLKEAVNSGFIENNVDVTLSTLFNKKESFYVNNKTYKIYSYVWDKKWELAKQSYYRSRRYRPRYSTRRYNDYRPTRRYNYGRSRYNPYSTRRQYYGGSDTPYGPYILVNIYLELYPADGTKKDMGCLTKYEKLKMEYAALNGTEYRMDGTID